MLTADIVLSEDQQAVVDLAVESLLGSRKLFRIGGYAGVGKTVLAREIVDTVPGAAVCAFTGKAASVLRAKGLDTATTIHRAIYLFDMMTEKFYLKPPESVTCKYFLLDEASTVNCTQWEDMKSFGKPIIAIGDPGQLEPVGEDPRLMEDPDVVLTKIHRQAEDSPIVKLATHVRLGGVIEKFKDGPVEVGGRNLFAESMEWADIMLCGFNSTRVVVNEKIRKIRHGSKAKKLIVPGEQIVCLQNNNDLGFSNGEIFEVLSATHMADHWVCDIADSAGDIQYEILIERVGFGVASPNKRWWRDKSVMYADYGYCLSVHKFQGSEADKVAVISEQCDYWCPSRWSYTAITRAAKELRFSI